VFDVTHCDDPDCLKCYPLDGPIVSLEDALADFRVRSERTS
jgi:hypothetical protein